MKLLADAGESPPDVEKTDVRHAAAQTVQGNVALNAQTNFFFELDGDNIGVGPGFSSQLVVNGTVNLGGAVLTGVLDSGYQPAVGQSWVILQSTGAISGQFAQGGNNATFFLGTVKFLVTIANNGATNTITLGAWCELSLSRRQVVG